MRRFTTAFLVTLLVSMVAAPLAGAGAGTVAAPTGVSGQQKGSQIELSWNTVDDAVGYNVYRDGDYVDTKSSPPFVDTKATGAHTYYVTAFNEARDFSSRSSEVRVELQVQSNDDSNDETGADSKQQSAGKTPAPANVRVEGETLKWNEVDGAVGYNVYRDDAYLETTSNTSFPVGGEENSYYVTAFDERKEPGDKSVIVHVVQQPGSDGDEQRRQAEADAQAEEQRKNEEEKTKQAEHEKREAERLEAERQKAEEQKAEEERQSAITQRSAPDVVPVSDSVLSAPGNVRFEWSNEYFEFVLLWDAVDGAAGYNVYENADNVEIATVYGTDLKRTWNGQSSFYVVAFDEAREDFSSRSVVVQFPQSNEDYTVQPLAELDAPGHVRFEWSANTNFEYEMRWAPVVGAAGYNVYDAGTGSVIATVFGTDVRSPDWDPAGLYYVTAFDEAKNVFSPKSESVTPLHFSDPTLQDEDSGAADVDTIEDSGVVENAGPAEETAESRVRPDAPQGVWVHQGFTDRNLVRWEPVEGAIGYNVYRDTEFRASVDVPEFSDGIRPNSHTYYVEAYDDQGLVSEKSATVTGPPEPEESGTNTVDVGTFSAQFDGAQGPQQRSGGDNSGLPDTVGVIDLDLIIIRDEDTDIPALVLDDDSDGPDPDLTDDEIQAILRSGSTEEGSTFSWKNSNEVDDGGTFFEADVDVAYVDGADQRNVDVAAQFLTRSAGDAPADPGAALGFKTFGTNKSGPVVQEPVNDSLESIDDLAGSVENAAGIIHNSGQKVDGFIFRESTTAQQLTKSLDGSVELSSSTIGTVGLGGDKDLKVVKFGVTGAKATFDGSTISGDQDAVQRSIEDGNVPSLSDLDALETGISITELGGDPENWGVTHNVGLGVKLGKVATAEVSAEVTEFRDQKTTQATINDGSVVIGTGETDIREEKATFRIGSDAKRDRLGIGANSRVIDTDTELTSRIIGVEYEDDGDGTRSDDAQRHVDTGVAQLDEDGGDYSDVLTNFKSNQQSVITFDATTSYGDTARPKSTEDVFNLEIESKRVTNFMTSRDGTIGGDDDYSNGKSIELTVEETPEDGVDGFRVSEVTFDGAIAEEREDAVTLQTSGGIDITKTPDEIELLSNNALWYGGKDNPVLQDIANGKSAPKAVIDDKPSWVFSWFPGVSHDNTNSVDAIEKIELARQVKASDDNLIRKAEEHKKQQQAKKNDSDSDGQQQRQADQKKIDAQNQAADNRLIEIAEKQKADKAAADKKAAAEKAAADKKAKEKEAQRQRDSDSDQRAREATAEKQRETNASASNRAAQKDGLTGGTSKKSGGGSGGSSGGESRVICTHFYQAGRLDRSDWVADLRFTQQHIGEQAVRGYHAWGIPAVRLMRSGSFAGRMIDRPLHFIARHRAAELAYKMGRRDTPDYIGKLVRHTMEPLCWVIGAFVGEQNWQGLYSADQKAPVSVQA